MRVETNGIGLWFDVDGPALVPDGPEMRERPTVVLLHGGPGSFDHSYFKPDFARLAASAQVVYLVLGDAKAEAVKLAFGGDPDPAVPASLLRSEQGETIVLLDRAAAARLDNGS